MSQSAVEWVRDFDRAPLATEQAPPPRPFTSTDSSLKAAVVAAYCDGELEFKTAALIFQFQPLEAA